MAKQLQTARPTNDPADGELTLAHLLDPIALEARLVEARARRAAAIARRSAGNAFELAPPEAAAERPASQYVAVGPAPERPTFPYVAVGSVPETSSHIPPVVAATGRRGIAKGMPLLLTVIFLFGLIGGGAGVLLAPPDLRQRIADAIAPETQQAAAPETQQATPSSPAEALATSTSPAPMVDDPPAPRAGSATAAGVVPGRAAVAAAAATPAAPMPPAVENSPGKLASAASWVSVRLAPEPIFPDLGETVQPRTPSRDARRGADARALGALTPPIGQASSPDVGTLLASPSAEPAAPAAPTQRATLADARIFVHYPPNAAPAAALAVKTLLGAGAADATAMPVRFSIERANVRYYHSADRAAALDIAKILGSDPSSGMPEARDFTDFRPQPDPGMIEVWLAGGAPAAATRSPARQPVTAPRKAAVSSAAAEQDAEAIERIVLERAVERMLRERRIAN